ncbi:histone-lysine n-methyltransferase ezh1-like [Lentinula edodes]|uniref:Histone-lysine n-methyltransferase ezh1-like n=1 Tax=Lentinula edodes TaxID=5353 RepID=A0A1Q3E0Y6_LENED|nr:histone-lysine n-methyltransferase ezh1-like [Lentinula edodes]
MSAALYSEDDEDDFLSSLRTRSGSSSSTLSSRPNTCERAEAAERSDRYKLAVEVLRTVYHEFYDEHVRLAQEEIDKLKFSNEPLLEESPWITFFNSTDGEEQVIQLGEVHTIILENAFDDSEELYYYCCAPASQNMEELEFFTNFVPHADAPEFDLDEFLAWDEDARDSFSFPWQNLEDPDRDIIDVEVARILHYKHQFTFKEIDKLGLLRLSLRGPNDNPESGLIWMNSQRETIEWQSSCSAKLQLPRFPTNFSHGTLLETINAGVYHFCANPNCITSHCATHYTGDIRKRITQPFEPCEPKETQEGILLKYANLNPCSKFCFMTHLNEETIETSIWRAEDEQELRELLAFIPDANPCDLAVMCRKRCYEVYFHRKNIYPDNEILKRQIYRSLKIALMDWETLYLILPTIPAYIKVAVVPRLPTVLAILRGITVEENVDVPKIVPIAFPDVIAKSKKV